MVFSKKLSLLIPFLCLILTAFCSSSVLAQEAEPQKKVVIITKKIDENGNEVVDKKVLTGEDVETFHLEEVDNDNDTQIEVEIDDNDTGKTKRVIKIRKEVHGEDVEEIELDGDHTIMEFVDEDGNMTITIDNTESDDKVEVEKTVEIKDGVKTETTIKRTYLNSSNKAFLGVVIKKDDRPGVLIDKVIKDSPAQNAGLQKEDVITHINQTSVNSLSELSKALAPFKPNDSITITYLRAGKTITTDTILKAPSDNPSTKSINIWKTEDGEEIELDGKKHKFIKKEKEGN